MKNYIKYIPRSAFAAAIVLGASLSAEEAASQGTSISERHIQSQQSSGAIDRSGTGTRSHQANLRPMTASEVIGMNIDNAENEKIGEIDEIYVDSESGEVLALVVSTGGFLGFGQQQSLISPGDLRWDAERTVLHTDITKDQIRNAPRYEQGETTDFDQVRPMGASASDWEERRTQRSDRNGVGQNVGDRQATGEDRTERTDRNLGQNVGDRQTTGQERTRSTDRSEAGQSDRQVGGQSDRQVGGQSDRQVGGQSDRQVGGQSERQVGGQSDRQVAGQSERQVGGQSDRQVGGQSDRQVGGQSMGDRQAAGQERTERSDWSAGGQSQGQSLAISELLDMSVENRQGESVGSVDEAYLDIENWEVVGVVVSTGGFLGIGDRKNLFGLQEMSFDPSNETIVLDYNRDQISEFPEFDEDDQSVFENLRERMDRGSPRSTTSAAVQQ